MICFVTDNDGHWYKIPVVLREQFYGWLEAIQNDCKWEGEDFDKHRAMHPINYMFPEILVLKESTISETANGPFEKS